MTMYIAVLEKEPGTLWSVYFPDLPGCTSAGETAQEASNGAVAALRLWAEDALDKGETLPAPRSVDEIAAEMEADGIKGTLFAAPLLTNAARLVRVNISVPADALEAIDEAAKRHGMARSAFLTAAALEKIKQVA
ncbi:type II toxin-antitoxin system HicB family antitoxin [Labrys okinawensis]|uniref:type II toxin-antitoxin system HicB family antitoxin n=1 Tax=Labrys okinawensis TaxID=346911 RepID=UPI0039BD8DCC